MVLLPPSQDCNGIFGGPALLDSCGVCQLAYVYNFVTHVPTYINDTLGLVLGPTEILVMPNDPSNPLWNSSCSGCTNNYDPLALNFDSTASFNDGSCLYPDCNGIAYGTSVLDSCGVCQPAFVYDNLFATIVQYVTDTFGLVLGPTEVFLMPSSSLNPV